MPGTYTDLGLYKPARGEVDYEDEFALTLDRIEARLLAGGVSVKDRLFGAKGDNSTDDYAAMQAAIDTAAPIVLFPAGQYRTSQPLRPRAGQVWLGTQSSAGYSVPASIIKPHGSNQTLVDVQNSPMDRNIIMGLSFLGVAGTESAFKASSGGGIVSSSFWMCSFNGLLYAFDITGTAQHLIVWNWYQKGDSPSRWDTSSYVNDNHWIGCTWNGVRKNLPAVLLRPTGNPGQGNWFANCYFESCDRQAIVAYQSTGGVRDTYFEAINEDGIHYTDKNGVSHPLPAIDVQHNTNWTLDTNFAIGAPGEYIRVGNSLSADADMASRVFVHGQYWDNTDADTPAQMIYDFSNILEYHTSTSQFASSRGDATSLAASRSWQGMAGHWSAGSFTPDAIGADFYEVYRGDGTSSLYVPNNPTIANPTNATRGRTLTFEFTAEQGYVFVSAAWGNKFKLAGTFTPPTTTDKRRLISFYYDGKSWIETSRSPADIPL